ncbi:MAG: hypothetical protein H7329_03605, partial [Opitutaceae bacterium]|nr:hypothetical protein [Cytophagales bacterium]
MKHIIIFFRVAGICLLLSLIGNESFGQCPQAKKAIIDSVPVSCLGTKDGVLRIRLTDSSTYKGRQVKYSLYRYDGSTKVFVTSTLSSAKYNFRFTGLQSGTYDVQVTTAPTPVLGCGIITFDVLKSQGLQTKDVTSPVAANAGFDQYLCDSLGTNLGGNDPAPAGVPASTAKWSTISGPNTPTFANATNPTTRVNNLIEGDYVFRYTISKSGCVDTNFTDVNIRKRVSPKAKVGSDTTACSISSYNLKAQAISIYNVGQWDQITGPNTSSIADPTANSTTASGLITGVYKFRWFVSDNLAVCNSDSAFVTVTNNVSPSSPSGSISPNPVCEGKSVAFSLSPIIANASYVWQRPSGLTFNHTGAQPLPVIGSVLSSDAGAYSVTATLNGCTSASTSVGTLIVNLKPAQTTITASSASVCQGQNVTLTSSVSPVTWILPGGTTSASNPLNVLNLQSTGVYKAVVSSASCNSDTSSFTVTVTPNPVININPVSATICSGASTVLTASGATSYVWSPAAGLSATNIANPTANPVSTTTYTVTGTTGSCSGTNSVTVTVNPAPVVTINPASPTICAGSNTVLNAGGATSYVWSPTTGLSASNISNPTANPAVTTTYNVTGTTAGCTGSQTVTVTVIPVPIININPPSTTICSGFNTVLTASGATSYVWSPATGLSSTNVANPTASPVSTTTYTVTGITGSCSGNKTVTVTVNPTPAITINPGSPTICAGSNTVLTASGATTYVWSPVTGLSASNISNPTASPATTTTYTVSGTSAGCTGTQTVTVTVTPLPVININPASATICAGANTVLTASGATNYIWSPATGLSASNVPRPTASPASTTTYTVTGSTGTCSGTKTIAVTVTTNPVISINPSSATICSGSNTVLTASGATSYVWSPATGLSSSILANPTASPVSTTTYTVTGTTGSCSGKKTITVTVNPTPSITINPGSPTICAGSNTVLTASGATSYVWSPATGLSASNIANPTASPATTTTYTVSGTSAGCTGTQTVTVTVTPLPVININPASATICAGANSVLTASGATNYTWSPATGLSASIVASPTASPASTTTYTVTGSTGICSGTKTVTVTVTPNPVISINPSSASICSSSSTVLIAGGATSYLWSPGAGLSSTIVANPTANPFSTTTYTVTGTTGSCSGSNSVVLTVNPIPQTPTVPLNVSVCVGSPLNIPSNPLITGVYSWNGPNGFSASTQNANIPSITLADNGPYNVFVTNNGCKSATATTNVAVNQAPVTPTVNATPNSICSGQSSDLKCSNCTGTFTYSWTGPGFASASPTPTVLNITATGTYLLTLSANGCTSASGSATVTVKPSFT